MGLYDVYRQKLIDVGVITPKEAKALFVDLFETSKARIHREVGDPFSAQFPTRQYTGPGGFTETSNGWRFGHPIGICDSATYTESHRSALKCFSSYSKWSRSLGVFGPSDASASFVISLSGEPFLLIDFWNGKADWSCKHTNGLSLGIAHVNCGSLRKAGEDFYWWPSDGKMPYPYRDALPPVGSNSYYYQPYTAAQVFTNLVIKRAFVCLYAEEHMLRPDLFVANSTYSETQFDPGLFWPLDALREEAFRKSPLKSSPFFASYEAENFKDPTVDSINPVMMHWSYFRKGCMPVDRKGTVNSRSLVTKTQQALKSLGYVTEVTGDLSSENYLAGVRSFQQDNLLPVTGVAGPDTREAITNKLVHNRKSLS